jgi:hypothetical protein
MTIGFRGFDRFQEIFFIISEVDLVRWAEPILLVMLAMQEKVVSL